MKTWGEGVKVILNYCATMHKENKQLTIKNLDYKEKVEIATLYPFNNW